VKIEETELRQVDHNIVNPFSTFKCW